MTDYDYDPGEPADRRKHVPLENGVSYRCEAGKVVSHCPRGITNPRALLNDPNRFECHTPRSRSQDPDAIYLFHQGVLYRAEPTRAQHSYHAFPEFHEHFEKKMRGTARRQFMKWAEKTNSTGIDRWLRSTEEWSCK